MKKNDSNREREERLDILLAYLTGALDQKAQSDVERRLSEDPEWQKSLEEARAVFKSFEAWKQPEPPHGLAEKTSRILRSKAMKEQEIRPAGGQRSRGIFRKIFASAAIVLLALLIAAIFVGNMGAEAHDTVLITQPSWSAGSLASARLVVRDGRSFQPIPDASVRLSLVAQGKQLQVYEGKTDTGGTVDCALSVPDLKEGTYEIAVETKSKKGSDSFKRQIQIVRPYAIMVTTDKPLYRPDAKEKERLVHIRIMALRKPGLKPYQGAPVTIEVRDPEGNRVFKNETKTSEYGIAWCDYQYPEEAALGRYEVSARIGEVSSERVFRTVRYVLPKFKIAFETDKPWYRPGEMVKVTADLQYFFGEPVSKATLVLSFGIDVKLTLDNFKEVEPGKYEAFLKLPDTLIGTEFDRGDAAVTLHLTAEDTAGQRVDKDVRRIVTTRPVRIGLVPESGTLVNAVENRIYLVLSTPDGQPYSGEYEVRASSGTVVSSGDTDKTGVAEFTLGAEYISEESPSVPLTVSAKLPDGKTVEDEQVLYTATREIDRNGGLRSPVLLRTDRAIYRGGESVEITALTAGGDKALFLDIIRTGQTVLTKTVNMKGGKGTLTFDLPPELFGTLQLNLYRLNPEGISQRDTKIIYVEQPGGLEISARMKQDTYRPREKASIVFQVTDDKGKPTQAALSVSIVDEALLAIAEEHPGLAQVYFAIERELLEPAVEIHGLEAPESLILSRRGAVSRTIENASFATIDVIPTNWRAFFGSFVRRGLIPVWRAIDLVQMLEASPGERSWDSEYVRERLKEAGVQEGELRALQSAKAKEPEFFRSYPQKEREWREFRDRTLGALGATAVLVGLFIFVTFLIWLLVRKYYAVVGFIFITGILIMLAIYAQPTMLCCSWRSAGFLTMGLEESEGTAPKAEKVKKPGVDVEPFVREEFPETLLWLPQIITDEKGISEPVEITMADSITTWQMLVSAVSKQGKLGALEKPITVFQPFFVDLDLPVSLTQNDEITIPVIAHNHLESDQTVKLTIAEGTGFEILDEKTKELILKAHEVSSAGFRIRVTGVERISLEVAAQGSGSGKSFADAIRREVPVVPDGKKTEWTLSDRISGTATARFVVPPNAIPRSENLFLKIYPGTFAQVVEGLDSMLQRPYGCFEQASSTTYPNILVLDYLRETGRSSPEIEMKARSFIQTGCQRLLSFEVEKGMGSFSLFGHPPASVWLTAYGLMEFADMSRVVEIDPNLLQRTRNWLTSQQESDGSFEGDLKITAYVAWALAHQEQPTLPGRNCSPELAKACQYLTKHLAEIKKDGYLTALAACAAVKSLGAKDPLSADLLAHLKAIAVRKDGAAVIPTHSETLAWGRGEVATTEATALAAIAFLEGQGDAQLTEELLTSVVRGKDAFGAWYSTQATILSLKALTLSSRSLQSRGPFSVEVSVGRQVAATLNVDESQRDVVHFVGLKNFVHSGDNEITLKVTGHAKPCFQLVGSYYLPWAGQVQAEYAPPVTVDVKYDRTTVTRGQVVGVTATVKNTSSSVARMVMVDVGVPPGFTPEQSSLDTLLQKQIISRYEVTGRQVIFYLLDMAPTTQTEINFDVRARYLIYAKSGQASAWPYYEPHKTCAMEPVLITVKE
jgi:uncharacterized protein YfaS (alpha-2-macroglobulin family)